MNNLQLEINKIYYIEDSEASGYYKIINAPKIISYGSFIITQNIIDNTIEEFINIPLLGLKYRLITDEEKLELL